MPLPLPNLDDRSYADLVEQAQALIPALYPRWTDRNPTDPGIALIELLAWLTEMAIYRVDQVPDANYLVFLKLLNGPGWCPTPGDLAGDIRRSITSLREPYRAATCADYVYLATTVWPATAAAVALGPAGQVARATCLPRYDIERADLGDAPGHISLVVVPAAIERQAILQLDDLSNSQSFAISLIGPGTIQVLAEWTDPRRFLQIGIQPAGPPGSPLRTGSSPLEVVYDVTPTQFKAGADWQVTVTSPDRTPAAGTVSTSYRPLPTQDLLDQLCSFLDDRRLLTTHNHVVGPGYVTVDISLTLVSSATATSAATPGEAEQALRAFFDPLTGGSDGAGWPFGRPVYLSEVYALIESLDGVDHVLVELGTADAWRKQYDGGTTVVAITLLEHELVRVGDVSFP